MFENTQHRLMQIDMYPEQLAERGNCHAGAENVVQHAELCLTPVAVKKEEEGDTAYEPGVEEGRSKKSRGASGKRCAVLPRWIW